MSEDLEKYRFDPKIEDVVSLLSHLRSLLRKIKHEEKIALLEKCIALAEREIN